MSCGSPLAAEEKAMTAWFWGVTVMTGPEAFAPLSPEWSIAVRSSTPPALG